MCMQCVKSDSRAHKPWTPEETEYLQENWGNVSMDSMSIHLKRTKAAIQLRASKLGLGPFLDNGYKYVTKNALFVALGHNSNGYKNISWIQNRGLQIHRIKVKNHYFDVIYLDEFWKWAYENQSFLNFSKFEKYALGPEPKWVSEKRKNDCIKCSKFTTLPWTESEDLRLKRYLKEKKYGYKELSNMLHRTAGAIQRRICDLNIKERPIKANNQIKWTDEEYFSLGEMIKAGYGYEHISNIIGRSSKAIRGRVFDVYLTERLDIVRKYIGNGNFGDGRPDIPLRYIKKMTSKEKEKSDLLLSMFAGSLLVAAKLKSGVGDIYESYWQKDMCLYWNDVSGCTAHETNCDSCTSFRRIPVQFCKRCGKDFYERKSNDFCNDCRQARIQQARKKWAILNKKIQGGKIGMKARVPMMSESKKRKLQAEIKLEVDKIWKEMEQEKENDLTRRILKTFIFVMHEKYGYGVKRLADLVGDFTLKLEEAKTDEVYWEHIDQVVIDELKLPFKRDYTDKGVAVTGD